jgi:hypothetical protein
MRELIIPVGGFTATLILIAFCYQRYGRLFITYRLTERGLEICLLNLIVLFRVKKSDIAGVDEVSFFDSSGHYFRTLRFGNRLWGRCVRVRKVSGIVRNVIITPNNPREFAGKIRAIALVSKNCIET